MIMSLLKKLHLFRYARTTRSNVLPEYACARAFVARLASGTFLFREGVYQQHIRQVTFSWIAAVLLSGCTATAVGTNRKIASTENPETAVASSPYLRTQPASCDELKKAYDEGFRAGKEIIAAEFRTRSELNQPYVWKPPMISEVDMPASVVNGVMIPAHRELVIVKPGQWVRTENK